MRVLALLPLLFCGDALMVAPRGGGSGRFNFPSVGGGGGGYGPWIAPDAPDGRFPNVGGGGRIDGGGGGSGARMPAVAAPMAQTNCKSHASCASGYCYDCQRCSNNARQGCNPTAVCSNPFVNSACGSSPLKCVSYPIVGIDFTCPASVNAPPPPGRTASCGEYPQLQSTLRLPKWVLLQLCSLRAEQRGGVFAWSGVPSSRRDIHMRVEPDRHWWQLPMRSLPDCGCGLHLPCSRQLYLGAFFQSDPTFSDPPERRRHLRHAAPDARQL